MALSKLAVRRLTKLADFMDALPKMATEHFNMGAFINHHGDHDIPSGPVTRETLLDCGTTACAFGWAATCPPFVKAGLQMRPFKERLGYAQFRIGNGRWTADEGPIIRRFFDVSQVHAYALFGAQMQITSPKQWARMCRQFIRDNA